MGRVGRPPLPDYAAPDSRRYGTIHKSGSSEPARRGNCRAHRRRNCYANYSTERARDGIRDGRRAAAPSNQEGRVAMPGHVRQRGDVWYAVVSVGQGDKRKTVWRSLPQCKGKREAELACAKIVQEIANGGFALPDNATLAQWVEHWVAIGCPGRLRQAVGAHANERYENYLKVHVLPTLGRRPLQKLQAA